VPRIAYKITLILYSIDIVEDISKFRYYGRVKNMNRVQNENHGKLDKKIRNRRVLSILLQWLKNLECHTQSLKYHNSIKSVVGQSLVYKSLMIAYILK